MEGGLAGAKPRLAASERTSGETQSGSTDVSVED